jgi:hypothetical protein
MLVLHISDSFGYMTKPIRIGVNGSDEQLSADENGTFKLTIKAQPSQIMLYRSGYLEVITDTIAVQHQSLMHVVLIFFPSFSLLTRHDAPEDYDPSPSLPSPSPPSFLPPALPPVNPREVGQLCQWSGVEGLHTQSGGYRLLARGGGEDGERRWRRRRRRRRGRRARRRGGGRARVSFFSFRCA